jgi:hypothetical protein
LAVDILFRAILGQFSTPPDENQDVEIGGGARQQNFWPGGPSWRVLLMIWQDADHRPIHQPASFAKTPGQPR